MWYDCCIALMSVKGLGPGSRSRTVPRACCISLDVRRARGFFFDTYGKGMSRMAGGKKTKRVSISMDADIYKRMKLDAVRRDMTISALLADLIMKHCTEDGVNPQRNALPA